MILWTQIFFFLGGAFQLVEVGSLSGFINPGKLFKGPIINGAPVLLEVATGTVNADNSVAYGEYLTAARCLESEAQVPSC